MAEKKVQLQTLWKNIEQGKAVVSQQQTGEDETANALLRLDVDALLAHKSFKANDIDIALYTKGRYWELLRQLEDSQQVTTSAVLLRILCLLHLISTNERIGNLTAFEYLRDKVLPQLKQVEDKDDTGRLKQYREWLSRFCLGHDLPTEFWEVVA